MSTLYLSSAVDLQALLAAGRLVPRVQVSDNVAAEYHEDVANARGLCQDEWGKKTKKAGSHV